MPNVVPLPGEGRHQVLGDDRLPGPGPALHQHNRLLLVVIPTSQQAQNCIEDHLLLVQQHILPSALDYRTDVIQKFLARFVLAGQNKLESLQAVTGGQVLPEKLPELMGLIPGEKWNLAQQALELGRNEWAVVSVLVIGQVATGGEPDRPMQERGVGKL